MYDCGYYKKDWFFRPLQLKQIQISGTGEPKTLSTHPLLSREEDAFINSVLDYYNHTKKEETSREETREFQRIQHRKALVGVSTIPIFDLMEEDCMYVLQTTQSLYIVSRKEIQTVRTRTIGTQTLPEGIVETLNHVLGSEFQASIEICPKHILSTKTPNEQNFSSPYPRNQSRCVSRAKSESLIEHLIYSGQIHEMCPRVGDSNSVWSPTSTTDLGKKSYTYRDVANQDQENLKEENTRDETAPSAHGPTKYKYDLTTGTTDENLESRQSSDSDSSKDIFMDMAEDEDKRKSAKLPAPYHNPTCHSVNGFFSDNTPSPFYDPSPFEELLSSGMLRPMTCLSTNYSELTEEPTNDCNCSIVGPGKAQGKLNTSNNNGLKVCYPHNSSAQLDLGKIWRKFLCFPLIFPYSSIRYLIFKFFFIDPKSHVPPSSLNFFFSAFPNTIIIHHISTYIYAHPSGLVLRLLDNNHIKL